MAQPARILVVEDDGVQRALLEEICRADGNDVEAVGSGEQAIARAGGGWDLVVSDVQMGDGPSGMDVLAAFQQRSPQTPVILLTAFGDVTGAMDAIQRGAHDYVSKPFNVDELRSTVRRALERQRQIEESREARKGQERKTVFKDIVGKSPAMLEVYKMVARVAPSKSTVLVIGESGTGKELVAREIHNHSPRARAPFVAVNCSALSESLLESELFGHEKGAFTGAHGPQDTRRHVRARGWAAPCSSTRSARSMLKLQAQAPAGARSDPRSCERVGGQRPIPVDVRVVAATNRDAGEEVRGRPLPRRPLLYRLRVVIPSACRRCVHAKGTSRCWSDHFLHRISRAANGKTYKPAWRPTRCAAGG